MKGEIKADSDTRTVLVIAKEGLYVFCVFGAQFQARGEQNADSSDTPTLIAVYPRCCYI